jgi:hypothetical protein
MSKVLDSRRRFLSQCLGAAVSIALPTALGQETGVDLGVVREYPNAILLAVSPNGELACLYSTRHPHETFAWSEGSWKQSKRDSHIADEGLRVVELGSWETVCAVGLRSSARHASFFQSGERIYAETSGFRSGGQLVSQQAVIDTRSGKLAEHIEVLHPAERAVYYHAIRDDIVLATVSDGTTRRVETLVRAALPDYREIARAPFPVKAPDEPYGRDTEVSISADRRFVAYGTDHTVVRRRTEDLGITWTRYVKPGYPFGIFRAAISADGGRVAAAVVDNTFQPKAFYIGVYNGADGAPLAELPLNGCDGLAVSPDGALLAVGERVETDPRLQAVELAVSLIDLSSGKRLARVVHDQFHIGRGRGRTLWVDSAFGIHGIQFTSDGKYLITSGIKAKVWAINRVTRGK